MGRFPYFGTSSYIARVYDLDFGSSLGVGEWVSRQIVMRCWVRVRKLGIGRRVFGRCGGSSGGE